MSNLRQSCAQVFSLFAGDEVAKKNGGNAESVVHEYFLRGLV